MKVGDRVALSAQGRELRHLFSDPDVQATVVRPGISRSGLRVRLLLDGCKEPKTFAADFWQPVRSDER